MPFNASVRRGWQTWILVFVMLAIYWILVLPQVDLDPATPANVETLFFAVFAISMLFVASDKSATVVRNFVPGMTPVAQAPPALFAARVAPLRI